MSEQNEPIMIDLSMEKTLIDTGLELYAKSANNKRDCDRTSYFWGNTYPPDGYKFGWTENMSTPTEREVIVVVRSDVRPPNSDGYDEYTLLEFIGACAYLAGLDYDQEATRVVAGVITDQLPMRALADAA